jgi:hypothetical protein
MACQEMTEACLECKMPISVEMKSVAVHQEVPNEVVKAETTKALEIQYGDQLPATGCCRQPKKQTYGDDGSW